MKIHHHSFLNTENENRASFVPSDRGNSVKELAKNMNFGFLGKTRE